MLTVMGLTGLELFNIAAVVLATLLALCRT